MGRQSNTAKAMQSDWPADAEPPGLLPPLSPAPPEGAPPSVRCDAFADQAQAPDGMVLQPHTPYEVAEEQGLAMKKKMGETHKFFEQLSKQDQELWALVTEDISLQSMAGLQSTKKRLWTGNEFNTTVAFIRTICLLVINIGTVFGTASALQQSHTGTSLQEDVPTLEDGVWRICSDRIHPGCVQAAVPWKVPDGAQALAIAEAALIAMLASTLMLYTICFFCSADPCAFAGEHYFAMMTLPRITAKFSLMMFLHVGQPERLQFFVLRGEFHCLLHMATSCCQRREKLAYYNSVEYLRVRQGHSHSKSTDLIGLAMCGMLVITAVHALLVKLFVIYFAGLFFWTDWSSLEWFFFSGFANQLAGIALSSEIQVLRVLLFKFGGEDSDWSPMEIEACATYLSYFCRRLVEQSGRMRALMMLWTFNSKDLQTLLQGKLRQKEQAAVRDEHISMFHLLDSYDGLVALRSALLERSRQQEAHIDKVLADAHPQDRMSLLNAAQARIIGGFRLAARVQEHIWEWHKAKLLDEGKAPGKKYSKSKTSSPASPTLRSYVTGFFG